jgi:hypothetical protein
MIFSFGQSEYERIEVDVMNYERTPVGEYYDDNWLNVEIRVHAGGFCGKAAATIITGELEKFLTELKPLHEKLSGIATFTILEEQLSLPDRAGTGNRLSFTLQFDQSQLGISVRELEKVTTQFPVRMTSKK